MRGITEPIHEGRQPSSELSRVLVLSEDSELRERIGRVLRERLACAVEEGGEERLDHSEASPSSFQVVLTDSSVPRYGELIERVHQLDLAPEIVALSEPGSGPRLDLLRAGVLLSIETSAGEDDLVLVVERAAELWRLRAVASRAEQLESRRERFQNLAEATREIMAAIRTRSLDHDLLDLIARHLAALTRAEVAGVLLVKRPGFLSWEASVGHRSGAFCRGAEFAIVSGEKTGLTGHIAEKGDLFNLHGDALIHHFAVRGEAPASPSRHCYSLLAVPLKKKSGDQEIVVGLLRAENKKNAEGDASPALSFGKEDEEVIKIFAEAVVVALELSEKKDRLDRLVESSPDGIIAVDRQGIVTLFNEQAEKVLGYKKQDVLGRHVRDLYADPEEPRKIGRLLRGEEDGRLLNYNTHIRSSSGEAIPIRHSSTWIYNSRGEQIGSVGYFEDLRPLLLVERRLESLLEANAIVARAQSLPIGLDSLTEMMASLLPHTFCRILLRDDSRGCLDVQAVHVCEDLEDRLRLKEALHKRMDIVDWPGLDRLLDKGHPHLLHQDRDTDRQTLASLSRWLGLESDLQSLLLAPLRLSDKVVGLIEMGESEAERRPFSPEEIDFAAQIATNIAALIDRMRLSAEAERRGTLLTALDEASRTMQGERETSKLLKQITRLAVELVGCTAGGLFENRPHLEELELTASYGIPDQQEWRESGRSQTHFEGLVGSAARGGEIEFERRYKASERRDPLFAPLPYETAVAVPLKITGEVEAVLFIADETGGQQFGDADREILQRFAAQASTALHVSRLMSPENRSLGHLKLLHQISDYIQQEENLDKILHVVLTGITAGYGLGFNRAALLLHDEPRQTLLGRMAIGHLDQAEALQDWEEGRQRGYEDFSFYLRLVEMGGLPETPLMQSVRRLVLPLRPIDPDPLSRAVFERRWDLLQTNEDGCDDLPEGFREIFLPNEEMIIVPLEARGQILGLLVADNNITALPITQATIEALLTFVSTAAIAIDKHRLLQATKIARERLESCFAASTALVSSREPDEVLKDILNKTPGMEEKAWIKLMLIDELGRVQKQVISGIPERSEMLVENLRPHGYTMQIMRSRKPVVIEDSTRLPATKNSPFMRSNGILASIGLPFLLHGRPIGVLWINYDRPRRFEPFEIEALQLYVTQAALTYDSARRMDELKRLHDAAQAISKAHKLYDALHAIAHQALQVCSAQVAVLWPYDEERVEFVTAEAVAVGVTPDEYLLLRESEVSGEELADVVSEEGWLSATDVLDSDIFTVSSEFGESLKRAGVASFQAVALSVGEELVGILYVGYHVPRSFGDQDRHTLEAFANHAALSLKNIRLFDRVQKARQAAEIVARVTTQEQRDGTLQVIAEAVLDAVGCDAVVLFSHNQREDRWSYPPAHAGVRHPEQAWPSGDEKSLSRSIVGSLLRSGTPHLALDVSASPLLSGRRFGLDEGIASCFATPIEAADQKVGVMFINYRSRHNFTPENLRDIELFAHQAAVAIRNAQLFEALEKDQLRALQDFQHQIRGPIFQMHARTHALLAQSPDGEGLFRELEVIGALSAKVKRVSTYIRLYALLSRGEPLETKDADFSLDDLMEMLREGTREVSLAAGSTGPLFTFRIDDESFRQTGARSLVLDRNLVEHAIGNVLDNAGKYSYPGSEVLVRASRTEIGDFRISIVNRGIPILPEEVQSCVERGWQSPMAKHMISEGRGIGLWIVDNILKSLGGALEIQPTTPEGDTDIRLLFPASRVQ